MPIFDDDSSFHQLITRVHQGDDSAFGELRSLYNSSLNQMARNCINPALQSQLDPGDLLQHAELILWSGIKSDKYQITSSQSFLALARTIMERQAALHWRRSNREQQTVAEYRILQDQERSSEETRFHQHENEKLNELTTLSKRFVSLLDPIDQKLIRLRFEGYSTTEAAVTMKVSQNSFATDSADSDDDLTDCIPSRLIQWTQ